jgi:transposase-like protein
MPGKLAARVKGLSEAAFRGAFGTEEQCRAVLEKLRWPKGFICPACGHGGRAWLAERRLYQCNRCKYQVSLTAGTIFHSTKLPLTTWLLAIHLIVSAKNGISSIELGRRLGVKQTTAWSMKQKIMQVMHEREAQKPLSARVEIDDAYLGGARSSGKRGRGAAGKTPVVAAVETTAERRPRKLKLLPVKGFRKKEVEKLARTHLVPKTTVVSDGLSCWAAVTEAGCRHFPMVTGSGRQAARWAPFKWVNTTLGNIKAAIVGTCRQIRPAHAARYLASFAWRFNRRFQLDSMLVRFVHSAARTKPMPYRILVAG